MSTDPRLDGKERGVTRPAIIHKTPADWPVTPHLTDYPAARRAFAWAAVHKELAGLPGGGLNIAFEAVDRHVRDGNGEQIAFRFRGSGGPRELGFAELSRLTNRFANLLQGLGIARGERVVVLAGRIPELYLAVLGSLKAGAVVSPLFSAFGPEPIATRVKLGEGAVLVTTEFRSEEHTSELQSPLKLV